MWLAMERNPNSRFNIPFVLSVPPETLADVSTVTGAVGRIVSRHEALRTKVRLVDGEPRQFVVRSGRLRIQVTETQPGAAASDASRLQAQGHEDPFDHVDELPLRVHLVVAGGTVRQIVLVFSHLAVDLGGASVVCDDLMTLLTTDTLPPAAELQPLDLAHREQHTGSKVTDNAIRYWVEHLRRIPPRMFEVAGSPHDPRTQVATLSSPALIAAAQILAARHTTTLSTVLLTATTALVGAWTGNPTSALTVIVNNRFRPELRRVVCNLQKPGLFVLDLDDGATFDDLLHCARKLVLNTYRYAYYDQVAMDRAKAAVNAERRTEISPFCCFNDFSQTGQQPARPEPTGSALRTMRAKTTLSWTPNPSQVRCHFCARLSNPNGTTPVFSVSADTSRLPPDDIERFLYTLESYVVDSVLDKVHVAGLRDLIIQTAGAERSSIPAADIERCSP
jgi:hypothetical protein